ncbi:hypothetical protein IL306_008330 [Fusarium sp. DS 682]|nr:hypothetical protein IL306_008330 [Fusarium sp. DS 682]
MASTMAPTNQIPTPAGSRDVTPDPETKPKIDLTTKPPHNTPGSTLDLFKLMPSENQPAFFSALSPEKQQEILSALPPEEQQALRNVLDGSAAGTNTGGTDSAGGGTDAAPPRPPVALDRFELALLDTLSETLPELGKMCEESSELSDSIQKNCSVFKGRYPDRNPIDFLVYMEQQASGTEDNQEMKDQMKQYLKDPTPLKELKFHSEKAKTKMETDHLTAKETIRGLRIAAAIAFYSEAEHKFLKEHALPYLPNIGARDLTDFTLEFCLEFKERHPNSDIFELLFYAEQMFRVSEKDANTKIQEFIQQEKLLTIEEMGFGSDTQLIKAKGQEALNILEKLRKQKSGPVNQQGKPDQQVQPNLEDRATTYDAAARRSFRDPYVGTTDDPSADRCVIADPETGEQVEAGIIGRHPHRKKWLVCAIPSTNLSYPKLEKFVTIDGTSREYRDVLEKYNGTGSNRTIPVGEKHDLDKCELADFELNGVILLPWGNDTRISAFGVSNWKRNEFKMFAKTVCCNKWGRSGLAVLHSHLQMCGSKIPTGGKGKSELEIEARSWYP